jgi:hypothetical protein
MSVDEVFSQLSKMKRSELVAMAAEFHPAVSVEPKWNTRRIAVAIRKRQKADAGNTTATMPPASAPGKDATVAPAAQPAPPLPGFLVDSPGEADELPGSNRGGPRPGAGRPLGMTDDKAAVRNLPQIANATVKAICAGVFDAWAAKAGVPQLALSDEEAEALALPMTQLQEYYFPGMVEEITFVWVSAAAALYTCAMSRVKILRALPLAQPGPVTVPVAKSEGEDVPR